MQKLEYLWNKKDFTKTKTQFFSFQGLLNEAKLFFYFIGTLINIKTNMRYSLRSNEGVCLKHPSGRMN